jgi:hypothetical protein
MKDALTLVAIFAAAGLCWWLMWIMAGRALEAALKPLEDYMQRLKRDRDVLWEFAQDCRDNWDCDEDAHRYDTRCRKCAARERLANLEDPI